MTQLFTDSELFAKERPDFITDSQKENLINNIVDDIINNGYSDSEKDDIRSDIESIYPFKETGFQLAKSLDSYMANAEYDFTTEFIDFLHYIQFEKERIVKENVKQWVKAHKIKPKFADGCELIVKNDMIGTIFKEGDIVYVNYHYPETATYVIDKDPERKGGTLIPFEKVEINCDKK